MALRDLRQYRWKTDFHKAIWEKIKQMEPSYPRWTFEQLTEYGWKIRLNPTNRRGVIDLVHSDGTATSFKMGIDGQAMPHMMAIISNLYGVPFRSFTKENAEELKSYLQEMNSSANVTVYETGLRVSFVKGNAVDIYKGVQSTPLDESYEYPDVTTSEAFVSNVIDTGKNTSLYYTYGSP